jgi:DNA-binding transcriptional LysR family regulator
MTAQPSLSRQILQLEEELGVKLFERTNRRVELTGTGRIFLIDAQRTLHAADASIRHARENAEGTRGELRLGFIGGATLLPLPSILREYRRRYPDVMVVPYAMSYPEQYLALHAGLIDIGWSVALLDVDIATVTVATSSLMAVVSSEHPMASRTIVDVADLTGETLIILSHATAPILYDETMRLCLANGFAPNRVHELLEEQTVLGLVAAGFGVALVPDPWSVIGIPGIVFRTLSIEMQLDAALCWHRERHTPIVRSFVQTTLEMVSISPNY